MSKHLTIVIILYFLFPSLTFPDDAQLIRNVKLSLQSLAINVNTVRVYNSTFTSSNKNLIITYVITDTVYRHLSELSLVLSIGNSYNRQTGSYIFSTCAIVLDKYHRTIGTFMVPCSATRDFLLSRPTSDNFFSYRSKWNVILIRRNYFKSIAILMNW